MRRTLMTVAAALVALSPFLFVSSDGRAATGSPTAASPFGGNGHNISFDGRVLIVAQGEGWFMHVLRPERVRYAPGGIPILTDAFSPRALVQPATYGENALTMCEESPDSTPYACDDAGNPGGPYHCYDFVVIDSDATGATPNQLRRRRLRLWIENPRTGDATYHRHEWLTGLEQLRAGTREMRGIEPTVTRDGRLLVWQGHPNNNGEIDILMYSVNDTPCAATGWSTPAVISHMYNDTRVRGRYRLAERQLRAADGTPFADNQLVHGAYPWIFPDGDAITFTAAGMPCRATEDPPGCGPRRNALSVIGYPTNFGVAHIDGAVNPSTEDTVRLFFSSPGPDQFSELPVTGGTDVWPFFGSNTSNYTELVFDDGLDGNYAGVWHMNESVNAAGDLDRARTPDTSGYFNTGSVRGAYFPAANNGLFGKALVFGGDGDHVEVPHDASLDPVNAIAVEMWIRPTAAVDCDGNNNYRMLLGKGNIGDGSYSIVLEEGERFQARVRAGGIQRSVSSTRGIPLNAWSHIGFTYDGASGLMRFYIDGEIAGEASHPASTLTGSTQPLRIGGPGGATPICPNGNGSFQGEIDEVRVSRMARDLTFAPRPGNHARFVFQAVPPQVEAGQTFEAQLTYRNIGTTAWSPGTQHRLGAQAPMDTGRWGTGRVELPRRVQPGETVTITATLTAPSELGLHPMQWGLVQDGAEWFGPYTELVNVEVVAPGTLPDAGPLPGFDAGMVLPGQDAGPIIGVRDAGMVVQPGEDAGMTMSGVDAGMDGGGLMGGCAVGRGGASYAWLLVAAWFLVRRISPSRRKTPKNVS